MTYLETIPAKTRQSQIVAVQKGRGYTERQYGAAMLRLCYNEGHTKRRSHSMGRPVVIKPEFSPVAAKILKALTRPMTAPEISEVTGIAGRMVGGNMHSLRLRGYVTSDNSDRRHMVWTATGKVPPRPPRSA